MLVDARLVLCVYLENKIHRHTWEPPSCCHSFRSSCDRRRCVAMFLHTFGIDNISITSAQMATSRDVALILGDSHVFWLEKFVSATEVCYSGSLLECMDCAIAFHGYRGGTVASLEGNSGLRSWPAQSRA